MNNADGVMVSKAYQEQLVQANRYLHGIIDNLPHFIFWKDTESRFLGCNKLFTEATNLSSPNDIVGKTDYDMPWSREQAEKFRKDDEDIIKTKQAKLSYEEEQKQKDGSVKTMLVNKTPLYDDHGNVLGVLCIYLDITVLKQKESELIQAKKVAEEANFLKTQFIQNISHELRTPLNGMLGMADVLSYSPQLNEEDQEKIANIISSGQVLLRLVNDVLSYSKMESKQILLEFSEVDFTALVKDVIDSFLPAAQKKNVALSSYYADRCPSHIVMEATRVRQILMNFVNNAIKFTHQGSITVFIDCISQEADKILLQIAVKDTGIGIPGNQLEHIFERFYQVHPSYTQTYAGVGLGLAIVKELVTAMKGEIKVDSQLGLGSTFSITLPCSVNAEQALSDQQSSALQAFEGAIDLKQTIGAVRILLVEDSPINQKVMKYMLSLLLNCTITIAATGADALDKFSPEVDLVLLDIGLPDISGFDVAVALNERMSAENFSVPVVSITAHADVTDEHPLYQQLKFAGSLIKPVQIQTLKELLLKVLGKSK